MRVSRELQIIKNRDTIASLTESKTLHSNHLTNIKRYALNRVSHFNALIANRLFTIQTNDTGTLVFCSSVWVSVRWCLHQFEPFRFPFPSHRFVFDIILLHQHGFMIELLFKSRNNCFTHTVRCDSRPNRLETEKDVQWIRLIVKRKGKKPQTEKCINSYILVNALPGLESLFTNHLLKLNDLPF